MSSSPFPEPGIHISCEHARRFLLAAHYLLPPREKAGIDGVLHVIRDLRSIQFDPINVVGRNPDLVLQSRVKGYQPQILDDLLYKERALVDGWDKMASIYPVEDWPYFVRQREKMVRQHGDPDGEVMGVSSSIVEKIRSDGPQSSLDFKGGEKVDWSWGTTKTTRAALEALYAMGKLGIHHRVNNRRYFDLIENLLPEKLLETPDPNSTLADYQMWHVERRVGSMKLTHAHAGEQWGGILGIKSQGRREILRRLIDRGRIHPVRIEGFPRHVFFVRDQDLGIMENAAGDCELPGRAAFLAPLDNLLWDRKLVQWIFDFSYAWEVYKPAAKREYGYYVLPVLWKDRLVARVEPVVDREESQLVIQGWWWEDDVENRQDLEMPVQACVRDFVDYLDVGDIRPGEPLQGTTVGEWLERVA